MLKKFIFLVGKMVAVCSFFFATVNANTTCAFIYHQPELPDKVKQLRKF